MNSEELEQSLRTEFEGYLKNILAGMTQEVSQFQQKIDTEIEKHKSHLDEVFQEFSTRIQTQRELDEGFKESVVEHLRLARDEGARITATAIAEAEELTKSEQKVSGEDKSSLRLADIRDAINDISSQSSQSSILLSLITHAAKFTPRGAFFVVKNQHFVGWRVFGTEGSQTVDAITDIVFPLSASTILGESVRSLGAIESTFGAYSDDSVYLDQLNFSDPDSIFAIPLIARGRGVAAIYADRGESGEDVNLEALETLVSVAGLTVELLAAAQSSNYSREPAAASTFVAAPTTVESSEESEKEPVAEEVEHVEAAEETTQHDSVDKVESVENYDLSDSDVGEVESVTVVEETEVYEVESETVEVSHQAPEVSPEVEDSAQAADYSDEVESTEPKKETEEANSFSGDDASGDEDVDSDYSVYDDDLIEEVQSKADDDSDTVHVEASEMDEVVHETAEETVEAVEMVEEVAEAESEFGIYESAVEDLDSTDSSAPVESVKFETNQDFNSTPVQFESPVETLESIEPVTEETEVVETVASDEIEKVTFLKPETVAAEEFSVESLAEEVQKPVEPVAQPVIKTRFADRNLDLPIDVSEDERRLHNDARRFARLLVSEIKLYNEQKVKDGRDANDLYDRLREALDRSREMYDKRVQPAVVERFDYFHYEVVNTLADGEEAKLGATYPGAAVPV